MHTTSHANFIILDFITYLVRSVRPEAPHYKILPIFQPMCPPTLYLSEHPILKHTQFTSLP